MNKASWYVRIVSEIRAQALNWRNYSYTSTFYSLPTKLSRHFVNSGMLGSYKYVFLTTRSKIAQNDLLVVAKEVFNP